MWCQSADGTKMLELAEEGFCFEDTTDEVPPICCFAAMDACCFMGGELESFCFREGETEDDFVLADCSGLDAAPESLDECEEVTEYRQDDDDDDDDDDDRGHDRGHEAENDAHASTTRGLGQRLHVLPSTFLCLRPNY